MRFSRLLCGASLLVACAHAVVYDLIKDGGAVPGDDSSAAAWKNGAAFNATLAKMRAGDELVVPAGNVFHVMGGIMRRDLDSATIHIDGTVVLSKDMKNWPRDGGGHVLEFFHFTNMSNFTVTAARPAGAAPGANGAGLLDGQGATWWGIPGVGYLRRGENRPRMLKIDDSKAVLVENLLFKDPPYWTVMISGVDGLEIRHSDIDAWRVSHDKHTVVDLTAFNTDGFDFTGKNIHIHHCTVWNQDDTFCVKDGTENVLIEHINASGVGLTIGSISSHVRNITFRDVVMHHTYKGIYMKFRGSGVIEDVLYENILMDEPEQFPIWIGPAQQSDSSNLCAAHPCSICWPADPWAECNAPAQAFYKNVTLRNITVNSPKGGENGVILANATDSPMVDITFDNVVINNPSTTKHKWGAGYLCKGVKSGVATGTTSPVPDCFEDRTDRALAAARSSVRLI